LHLHTEEQRIRYFSERVILAPRNIDVTEINNAIQSCLAGEGKTYLSADCTFQDGGVRDDSIPQECLNTLTLSGMPVHKLTLKIGCPIILLRNVNSPKGLCNGTRLIVTKLLSNVIEAKVLTGSHAGRLAFIPRISLDTTATSGLAFTVRRRQFPIRIAYAMTINKSQGQSLRIVGLHLLTPVFSHGQLYVALSRCTDSQNLHVLLPRDNVDGTTDNIVYKEVLG
jgi:ATP-dependent exoDNAse (exonuclease V) alpha subunit